MLLSLQKLKVKKKPEVRWEYGIVNSTVQTIWINRTKIISAFEQNGWRIKRFRKTERRDVDEALIKRFKREREREREKDSVFSKLSTCHDSFCSPCSYILSQCTLQLNLYGNLQLRAQSFLFLNFNCNLNLKYTIALTLNNMPAGLYFVLIYFSFTFSIHLAYRDTHL